LICERRKFNEKAGDYPLTKIRKTYYLTSPNEKIAQENYVNYSWNYAKRGGGKNHLQAVIPQGQCDYRFEFAVLIMTA